MPCRSLGIHVSNFRPNEIFSIKRRKIFFSLFSAFQVLTKHHKILLFSLKMTHEKYFLEMSHFRKTNSASILARTLFFYLIKKSAFNCHQNSVPVKVPTSDSVEDPTCHFTYMSPFNGIIGWILVKGEIWELTGRLCFFIKSKKKKQKFLLELRSYINLAFFS